MAPNNQTELPPIASRSDGSTNLAIQKSSKKLKQLISMNDKLDKIFSRLDDLEGFIKTHCNNISEQVRSSMAARRNRFYKTKLCRFYQNGNCYHGTSCRFAHGESELRPLYYDD